ncbi:hypothetical protein FACS1894151_03660 [Spirochaetia bacterium]|nr:hypothetical protein FACS1894151_03660 [Spirochaetia bacterium]
MKKHIFTKFLFCSLFLIWILPAELNAAPYYGIDVFSNNVWNDHIKLTVYLQTNFMCRVSDIWYYNIPTVTVGTYLTDVESHLFHKYKTSVTVYDSAGNKIGSKSDGSSNIVQISGDITIKIWIKEIYHIAGIEISSSEYNATVAVRRDITPPSITTGTNTEIITNANSYNITAAVSDSGSGISRNALEYSINNAPTGSPSFTVATLNSQNSFTLGFNAENVYYIYFRATDYTRHASTITRILYIDRTAPVIAVENPSNNIWTNSSVTLRLNISDSLAGINGQNSYIKETFTAPNGTPAANNRNFSNNNTITVNTNGITEFSIRAEDRAGNSSTATTIVKFDNQGPVITFTGDTGRDWTNETERTVSYNITDSGSGYKGASISRDLGSTWTDIPDSSGSITVNTEGINTITIRACDNIDNLTETTYYVQADYENPVLVLTGDMQDTWTNEAFRTISADAADSLSGVQSVQVKESVDTDWETADSRTITDEGSHTVIFKATDMAGNSIEQEGKINIDRIDPVFTAAIGIPHRIIPNGIQWIIPVTVSGASDDLSGIDDNAWKYKLDGDSEAELIPVPGYGGTYHFSINKTNPGGGSHKIMIICYDMAGNRTSMETDFVIDDTSPEINVSYPFGSAVDSAGWTKDSLTMMPSDSGAGIEGEITASFYKRQGDAWAETQELKIENNVIGAANPEPKIENTYKITATVSDRANNLTTTDFYLKFDNKPPVVTIADKNWGTNNIEYDISDGGSGADWNSWEWRADSVIWNRSAAVTLPEGKNTFYYRISDNTGNILEDSKTITVDISPPVINASIQKYVLDDQLKIEDITITDFYSNINSAWYLIDNNTQRSVFPVSAGSLNRDNFQNYSEGRHKITLFADDTADPRNTGYLDLEFIIDRTKPEILSLQLFDSRNPEKVLGSNDYTALTQIKINLDSEDFYHENGIKQSGKIAKLYYFITQNPDLTPVFTGGTDITENYTGFINGFNDGINFLYLCVADGAGNKSDFIRRIVNVDVSSPPAPKISSTTHIQAVRAEQAGFLSGAEFQIRPLGSIPSGIRAYQWQLKTLLIINGSEGPETTVKNGITGTLTEKGAGSLSLFLDDNEENQFYRLYIRCIGENGNEGTNSFYQFRIDSTAPGEVIVTAYPQIDSSAWYNHRDAKIIWNKPADMTGILQYRYYVTTDKDYVFPDDENSTGADISSWIPLTENEITVNLQSVLGDKKHGTIRTGIAAIDYAGNRRIGTTSINTDFTEPKIKAKSDGEYLTITDIQKDGLNGKSISWEAFSDNESGMEYISLVLNGGGVLRSFTLASDAKEYTIEYLPENTIYTVQLCGFDFAGNRKEIYSIFATGTAEIPGQYTLPYSEIINGYELSGRKIISGNSVIYSDIVLTVPKIAELFRVINVNGTERREKIEKLPLESVETVQDRIISGKSAAARYEMTLDGFTLSGAEIIFDSGNGPGFSDSIYNRDFTVNNYTKHFTISLGSVNFGIPPVLRFSSGAGFTGEKGTAATISTLESPYSDKGSVDGLLPKPGFPLTNIGVVTLHSGKEWLSGQEIATDVSVLAARNIRLAGKNGTGIFAVDGANLLAGNKNVSAALVIDSSNPSVLTLQNTNYEILKAGIRGQYLDIYEAILKIHYGSQTKEIKLRNFIIDSDTGYVYNGLDFSHSDFSEDSPNGAHFEGESFTFGLDGKLYVSGILSSGIFGTYQVSGLLINNNGADWDNGVPINGFTTTVHGFPVFGSEVLFSSSGLFIKSGNIDLFDGPRAFENLGLSNNKKDDVYNNGIITEHFSASTGYGSPVLFYGGTINNIGVFSEASVPLNPAVTVMGGMESMIFSNLKLEPDGTVYGEFHGSISMRLGEHNLNADNVIFNGNLVIPGQMTTEPVHELGDRTIAFNDLSFSYDSLTPGKTSGEYLFSSDNWTIWFPGFTLDGGGIYSNAYLQLPEKLGKYAILLEHCFIMEDGFLDHRKPNPLETISLHGLRSTAYNIHFTKRDSAYVLECEAINISLNGYGEGYLNFGETFFGSDGMVFYGGYGSNSASFISSNGYRIKSTSGKIGDDSVLLAGSIGALWWNPDIMVSFPAEEIALTHGFTVTAAGETESVNYLIGGWPVQGTNIRFEESRIDIENNNVLYHGTTINLGAAGFSAEGLLLQPVTTRQNLQIPVILENGTTLIETRLYQNRLEGSLMLHLPDFFSTDDIQFQKVILYSDGRFASMSAIPSYTLTAGDFRFSFRNITAATNGIEIQSAVITAGESMENTSFELNNLVISDRGIITKSVVFPPFELWGMVFSLKNFSIYDGIINFEGSVRLDTLPGEMSGMTVDINNFRVRISGEVLSFDLHVNEEHFIPFLDEWALNIKGFGITYNNRQPWIIFDQALLQFPGGYFAENIAINNLRFNPLTGQFDYSDIRADTNVKMVLGNITFYLNRIFLTKDLTIGFGGKAEFPAEGVPEFLAGKSVDINTFEITKDGKIGNVSITLDSLNGYLFRDYDGFYLQNGSVSMVKTGNYAFVFSVSGDILLTGSMPDGIAGSVLRIENFTVNSFSRSITELRASALLPQISFYGAGIKDLAISLNWTGSKEDSTLSLAGKVILPDSFPDSFAGKTATLNEFVIGFDGSIKQFSAGYETEKGKYYDTYGFLQMKDILIEIGLSKSTVEFGSIVEFGLDATILLPAEKFPEGIGGTSAAISIRYDSRNGLTNVNSEISLPDREIFGTLQARGVKISIARQSSNDIYLSLSGSLLLPDSFPVGLRGVEVAIRKLSINAAGSVNDVDIGVSGLSANIFDIIALSGGTVQFGKGTQKDEFIININGKVTLLAEGLPDPVKNASLSVNKLELSTISGLRSFEIGLESAVSYSIFGGIQLNVNSLTASESFINLNASAKLPANYPRGLAGTQFDLSVFKIGWDGTIIDIQGGLGAMNLEMLGFTVKIDKLYFVKDSGGQYWVTLESCRLQLPSNFGSLGGQYLAIKNAKFSPADGSFMGDFEASSLVPEIAGFRLELQSPSLNFSSNTITIAKAILHTPALVGSFSISLNRVTISAARGITIEGGAFRLPSFKVGGLGFENIGAELILSGSNYVIAGQGAVFIPGAGTISAYLSFTNISSTYPVGLQRAEFSYILATGGIPLGTTGLYLNGISGGITYGPPNEVPSKVRNMFGSGGPRVKLGLSVGDYSGGSIISMWANTWIDVTNIAWAFEGTASILRGTLDLNASIVASLTNAGFYAGTSIELKFVKGSVEFYIFNRSGRTVFSGTGNVQLGLSAGAIVNKKIVGITVRIPDSNIWLPKIQSDFGQFTNGKTGFKGYVKIPVLGDQGVFVGPGTFVIGGVSGYTIEKPSWTASIRSARSFAGSDSSVISGDSMDRGNTNPVTYNVFIPALKAQSEQSREDSGLERLIFILAYAEGDPEISVVSPSEITLRPGSALTETLYMENALIFTVLEPEAGAWKITVSNIAEDAYEIETLGTDRIPALIFTEPSEPATVTEYVELQGITDRENTEIVFYISEAPGMPGIPLGSCVTDQFGYFRAALPLLPLSDGEYFVYSQFVLDHDKISPSFYAPYKITIDRSLLPLNAVSGLRVSEIEEGTVMVSWENTNGARAAGHYVHIENTGTGFALVQNTGTVTSLTIPGYINGDELSFAVSTADYRGLESPLSEPVTIKIGAEKPLVNRPYLGEDLVCAAIETGNFLEGTVQVSISDYKNTNDSSGYILIRSIDADGPTPLPLYFDGPVKIEGTENIVPWRIGIPDSFEPGLYRYTFEVINEGNPALKDEFTMEITVQHPRPEISIIEPAELNGSTAQVLTIYGKGFSGGTRVFLDNEELVFENDADTFSSKMISVIVPVQAHAGKKQISVRSPGGSANSEIEIVLPDWTAVLYIRSAETVPGNTVSYPVEITGINGFDGTVILSVTETVPGFTVHVPAIKAGETGFITVTVSENTVPGTYKTGISGGEQKIFELITVVSAAKTAPHLSGVSPARSYAFTEAHVYGYGLGNTGTLTLNSNIIGWKQWSDGEIVFIVPSGENSGMIKALTENGESNEIPFVIRKRGFNINPSEQNINTSAGLQKTSAVSVSGYSDLVLLTTSIEPGAPFTLQLDRYSVIPNAVINITVNAHENAENGVWKCIISGRSGDFSADTEITVSIGDSFTIDTKKLPAAFLYTPYYVQLECLNGSDPISYRLGGLLPDGITLETNGRITGIPAEKGTYSVVISAEDAAGHSSTRNFTITVDDDNWGQTGKDGGNSNTTGAGLPSVPEKLWQASGSRNGYLLAASGKIINVSEESITVFRSSDGLRLWSSSGSYTDVIYTGDKLYALSRTGTLEARSLATGSFLWSWDNADSFSADDNTVIINTENGAMIINASRGALLARTERYAAKDKIFWKDGSCYEIRENRLVPLYGGGNPFETEETIYAVSANSNAESSGAVIATENFLILLDADMREIKRTERYNSEEIQLALTTKGILLLDQDMLAEYSVDEYGGEKLALLWDRYAEGTLSAGSGKAVVSGKNGLTVINRFSGDIIWEDEKTFVSHVLYQGHIITSDSNGILSAIGGKSNAAAPVTNITMLPSQPDGLNGWYVTKPELTITAFDRETFAESTFIQYNNGAWQHNVPGFNFDDGNHTVAAYSIDTEGLRGSETFVNFRLDTQAPESTVVVSGSSNENFWHTEPVTLTLEAQDTVSGISHIWTSQGNYTGTVTFSGEGIHHFYWYAADRAGNRETLKTRTIKIDYTAPSVEVSADYDSGLCMFTITATDSVSGANMVEYRINDGPVMVYGGALLITEGGKSQIHYRATDNAGNTGKWNLYDIWVTVNTARKALLQDIAINGNKRAVFFNAGNGIPAARDLASTLKAETEDPLSEWHLGRLPSYIAGSEYILWDKADTATDESAVISFRVTKDLILYALLPEGERAPESWALVEKTASVNRIFYPSGTDVYMKRQSAGNSVELYGTSEGKLPPVIFAQEYGGISADISIGIEQVQQQTEQPKPPAQIPYLSGDLKPGTVLVLNHTVTPWRFSRRLPLHLRWMVNSGEGWAELESNYNESRYEIPETSEPYIRLRLEVYTPDMQIEYRAERIIGVGPAGAGALPDADEFHPENQKTVSGNYTAARPAFTVGKLRRDNCDPFFAALHIKNHLFPTLDNLPPANLEFQRPPVIQGRIINNFTGKEA